MCTGELVALPKSFHPMDTFMVRVWREWSEDKQVWRGIIEHLESKQRARFTDLDSMLSFLQSLGMFYEKDHSKKRDG